MEESLKKGSLKQYELPEGSVVLVPTDKSFHRYTYRGTRSNKVIGLWEVSLRDGEPVEFQANLFGTFQYNASQNYFYYVAEES